MQYRYHIETVYEINKTISYCTLQLTLDSSSLLLLSLSWFGANEGMLILAVA